MRIILISLFCFLSAYGAEIRLVREGKVLINIIDFDTKTGQILNVLNPEKEVVGQIRVIKIRGNRAVGKIRSGQTAIKKGHTVSLELNSNNYIGNRVMKRRENKVLINTYKLSVKKGDILTIFTEDNIEIGEIKIMKVGKNKAIGKIINESKRIAPGHLVESTRKYVEDKRSVVKVKNNKEAEKVEEEEYTGKRLNLRISPLHFLFGLKMAELDIRLGKSITLGPSITMIGITADDIELTGSIYGIRGNYYFNKNAISTGWILGATAGIISIDITFQDLLLSEYLTSSMSGSYASGLLAYQWVWGTLNLTLGGGATYWALEREISSSTGYTVEIPYSGINPAIEASIGLAF